MITLHEHAVDETAIFSLLHQHAPRFLQTNEVLDEAWVKHLVTHETLWSLTLNGQLVGVIWWEALTPGQSAIIHLVLQPDCVRAFWRQQLGQQILYRGISLWQLKYIVAQFEPHRQQPAKWLTKLGFKPGHISADNQWVWLFQA